MIARNLTALICLAFSALACGGEQDAPSAADDIGEPDALPSADEAQPYDVEQPDQLVSADPLDTAYGVEVGSLEQAITAPSSPNGTDWGVSTGGTRAACDTASAGQACVIPELKKVNVCIVNAPGQTAFTAGEIFVIKAAFQTVEQGAGGLGTRFSFVAGSCQLTVSAASGIGSGSTSTALTAYREWTPLNPVTVTTNVPGSWKSFASSTCRLDMADITARANADGDVVVPAGNRRTNMLTHAAGSCAAHAVGMGTRDTGLFESTATSRSIGNTISVRPLSTREACIAKNANFTTLGTYALSGTCQ
jgi:hypothetical protein